MSKQGSFSPQKEKKEKRDRKARLELTFSTVKVTCEKALGVTYKYITVIYSREPPDLIWPTWYMGAQHRCVLSNTQRLSRMFMSMFGLSQTVWLDVI